jgi:hypothetical protein
MCSVTPDDAHGRLAQMVEDRRNELGISQRDVARSTETYARIMTGLGIRDSTVRRAERALKWRARSFEAILAGGQPTITADDDVPSTTDARDRRLRVIRDLNGAAVDVTDLPEETLTRVEKIIDELIVTIRDNPSTT